ncbi:MAG: LysE family translocator [Candidatus Atribacteria bacterium]|nr:LysE family translocator [Candidatus Atribacteria bacterium]
MLLSAFLLEAVLISLSGVIAPGPVTAVTVSKGTKSPHAGAMIALGHGIVEIPLMILMLYGFGDILKITYIKAIIGLLGGLFLLKMGLGLLKGIKQTKIDSVNGPSSPLMAGIILTLANPYFLVWMATIGSILIFRSYAFGLLGVTIFMVAHWSCDFLWLYFLSALSFKGGQFFGKRLQQVLFIICGVFLLFFSTKFIYDAAKVIFSF